MTICHGSPWCRNVADDHCPFSIRGWWLFFYPLSYLTLTSDVPGHSVDLSFEGFHRYIVLAGYQYPVVFTV